MKCGLIPFFCRYGADCRAEKIILFLTFFKTGMQDFKDGPGLTSIALFPLKTPLKSFTVLRKGIAANVSSVLRLIIYLGSPVAP
jgi:hypothetical protein